MSTHREKISSVERDSKAATGISTLIAKGKIQSPEIALFQERGIAQKQPDFFTSEYKLLRHSNNIELHCQRKSASTSRWIFTIKRDIECEDAATVSN